MDHDEGAYVGGYDLQGGLYERAGYRPHLLNTADKIDSDVGVTHWDTCFHREPEYELVREAEQVAVFLDTQQGLIHVSVRDGMWFSCKALPPEVWVEMPEPSQMAFIQEQLNFLRTLRE